MKSTDRPKKLNSHHLNVVTATLCINKILLNNYLNFTLQNLHHYYFNIIFFKGKKLKIRSYQEFSHEILEKIKSGKIRNNQENQEVLDGLYYLTYKDLHLQGYLSYLGTGICTINAWVHYFELIDNIYTKKASRFL